MTSCNQMAEWMSERIDGELDAERQARLDAHLTNCAVCRRTLAAMERLATGIDRMPLASPRDCAVLAVNNALHALTPKPHRTEFGPVMDMEELAEFLRVSMATVGQYLDELPSFELGGKLLFRRTSIEQWIEQREHRLEPAITRGWIETTAASVN